MTKAKRGEQGPSKMAGRKQPTTTRPLIKPPKHTRVFYYLLRTSLWTRLNNRRLTFKQAMRAVTKQACLDTSAKAHTHQSKTRQCTRPAHPTVAPETYTQRDTLPHRRTHGTDVTLTGRRGGGTSRNDGGSAKPKLAKATVAPKRRSSQVARILLDGKSKTTRRIQMLEDMIKPFRVQPCFMNDPIIKSQALLERTPALKKGPLDIENTAWCTCQNCCVVEMEDKHICCHGISSLRLLLNEDKVCITSHPFFQEMCLDHDQLDFLYRFWGQTSKKEEVLNYIHKLRRTAYRAFMVWAHGFLDRRNPKPIPACVVRTVRASLPYPEELNVGFMKMYDYPAAIMALGSQLPFKLFL
ncbi:uncharacterized protein LOC134576945 [Pelobates fuscus]|uniref:uncharacterized protein LOC134576945 n=1 Tax=Pelobates fuscus TaxID=191477 RepID=UPI002FE436BA